MKLQTTQEAVLVGVDFDNRSIQIRLTKEEIERQKQEVTDTAEERGRFPGSFYPPFPIVMVVAGHGKEEMSPAQLRELGGLLGAKVRYTTVIEIDKP
jgi:hypothetical protein